MLVEFKCAGSGGKEPDRLPSPGPPRTRGAGARLVAELLALAGGHGELVDHRQFPWASITFSGTRHEIALHFAGGEAIEAGETFVVALPDHEFSIPRQLVADATIRAVEHAMVPAPRLTVCCEILLLEDD